MKSKVLVFWGQNDERQNDWGKREKEGIDLGFGSGALLEAMLARDL